eukprot:4202341-Ditylum_brightwellii.AAC.1
MADALEKDYTSVCDVMEDVNEMRHEIGKKGGSDDPHDNWCKARFNLNKQLLIRCGKLDPTISLDLVLPKKDGERVEE